MTAEAWKLHCSRPFSPYPSCTLLVRLALD